MRAVMEGGPQAGLVGIGLCCLATALGGCTAVLGDFSAGGGDSGAGDVVVGSDDAGDGGDAGDGSVVTTPDGGVDARVDAAEDATEDAPRTDASEAGPPPVPAKPGFDLTAGGNVSTSTSFMLVGAVGESPGSNVVSQSTSYTLKGGVIAVTQ